MEWKGGGGWGGCPEGIVKGQGVVPQWFSGKESAFQCMGHGFNPWFEKIPSPCAATTEPVLWSLGVTTEALHPGARAPKQEKPRQREAGLHKKSAPTHRN